MIEMSQSDAPKRWRKYLVICARWLFFLGSIFFLLHFAGGIVRGYSFDGLIAKPVWLNTGMSVWIISVASVAAAMGWASLLAGLACPVAVREASAVYFTTQIAKYLPGNVGHYVGRVALARTRLAIPSSTAILSLMQETALTCLGAVLVGLCCFFIAPDRIPNGWGRGTLCVACAFVVLVSISGCALADMWKKKNAQSLPRAGKVAVMLSHTVRIIPQLRTMLRTTPFYLGVYTCVGIAASLVAASVMTVKGSDVVFITGAYSLAWVAGFLIPGAPGGLGVRESALVVLLASTYPKEAVLMIALLTRLASVGSDLLMFVAGLILMRSVRRSKISSPENLP